MHVIVGDIHGCIRELEQLLKLADFKPGVDTLVSVGDLVDRGPDSPAVLDLMIDLKAIVVRGNHDDKLLRWMLGNKVKVTHGLETTIAQLEKVSSRIPKFCAYLNQLPFQLETNNFVLAHAQPFPVPGKICSFGQRRKYENEEVRFNWWDSHNKESYGGKPVFYGHYWFKEVQIVNNTYGLDTSCVAGGKLSGFILEENQIISVAGKEYYKNHKTTELEQKAWQEWKGQ